MAEPTAVSRPADAFFADKPAVFFRRIWHCLRGAAKWLTIAYGGGLLVTLAALEWWGERNWLLSLLLFAPPQVLLAPVALLGPLCLICRPKWLLVHLGCAFLLCFVFMTYRHGPSRGAISDQNALTVITHNVGQGNRTQFMRFVEEEKPDLVLLQDARSRGPDYVKTFPDRYVAGRGEFYLVSRFQIRRAEVLPKPQWRGRAVAARFEVDCNGRPLVLYNVHLPTPRAQFNRFLSKRVVLDLFGNDDQAGGFASYREWIDARREMATELAGVFASEAQPFLACGDFNTPDHGFIYHLFAREMTDAHAAVGRGWGMTFPDDIKSLVAIFGPWLRIDYAFAGKAWKPVQCAPEPGSKSQHRAVVARFVPEPAR